MSSPSRVTPFGSRNADSTRVLQAPSQAIFSPCPPHSHGSPGPGNSEEAVDERAPRHSLSHGARGNPLPPRRAEGRTAPQVEQPKQSTQLRPSGTTRQRGSNAQVRDDEGRSRGEAQKGVSRNTEETPFPPVDSSMEQKPKGFPVPDGVDGVEGISQKPSLVIYRRPIGLVSERKRSTPVRGTHCSDSLFATLSVISERKEFYSGQSNAGW